MNNIFRFTFLLLTTLLLLSAGTYAASYSVVDLASFSGGYISGISSRGTITGGMYVSPGVQSAFLWNQSSGFTYLSPLPGYGQTYCPSAINDSGQLVGYSYSGDARRATLWEAGKPAQDIGGFIPRGINNASQVTGIAADYSGPVLWTASSGIQDLTLAGVPANVWPMAINDGGTIVGSHGSYGFVWSPSTGAHDILAPDNYSAQATAVNNAGQVIINSASGSGPKHAYIWQEGHGLIQLGTLPGSSYTGACDINNLGQVVGVSSGQPFIWDSTNGMQSLPVVPGLSTLTTCYINDSGMIAGYAHDSQGNTHFLLWSVPEPSSLLALLAGLGGCDIILRRRKR